MSVRSHIKRLKSALRNKKESERLYGQENDLFLFLFPFIKLLTHNP